MAESIQSGIAGEMPQTLGLALAAGAFFFLLAVLDPAVRKSSRDAARIGSLTLGFGLLAAWCASDLCPWYALFRCEPLQALSKTLGKLQFAWRFFTPATMLLVVCACLRGGAVPQSPARSCQGNGRRPAGADHHPRRVPDV